MSGRSDPPSSTFRRRRAVLAGTLALGSAALAGRKLYELGAPPAGEKECDLRYPALASERLGALPAHPTAAFEFTQLGGNINDASCLNRTAVFGIASPRSIDEIASILAYARQQDLKVTASGVRHSMGGQSFSPGGLVIDMRAINHIAIDDSQRTMTVGAGATWDSILRHLDPRGLAVKAMQSVSIFTVGGTLSVNAHGGAHVPGHVASTVRSVRLMRSDGSNVTLSQSENADLFRHVLGGYGLFGLILEAEFDLAANELYRPDVEYIDYRDFPDYFTRRVQGVPGIGLVFGRLSVSPASYLRETAVHIYTRIGGPELCPPIVPDSYTRLERTVLNLSKTGSVGRWIRWQAERHFDALVQCQSRNQAIGGDRACAVSRNQEMDDETTYLRNRLRDTDILQEYFVAPPRFAEFVDGLRTIVSREGANLINATIRSVEGDTITALPYAPRAAFAIVLYFNQALSVRACERLERTTRALIDLAIQLGGRFYLPYQLYYSPAQLQAAYPEASGFFAAKRAYDPSGRFSNTFYENYGSV
jgi:FAD/FMN-containing dehydrogenase